MASKIGIIIGVLACGATVGGAWADSPLAPTLPVANGQPNTAQLIMPARLAPEVAVDRALAAQPVHPWMAHVLLGGDANSASMSTYIDPLVSIDTGSPSRLDSNHTFARAVRLYRQLEGVTTNDLAEVSAMQQAFQPRAAGSNQAQLIRMSDNSRIVYGQRTVQVMDDAAKTTHPAAQPGQPVPIPAVPRLVPPQRGALASAESADAPR